MARLNILETKIDEKRSENFCLWGCVDGKNSTHKRSKVSKMLDECESHLRKYYGDDYEIIIVEGGKRQFKTMGRHLAVMFRTRKFNNVASH